METVTPHISVVIPVYEAANCLNELYLRLKSALETIGRDFEIVLVEDCGGDSSWEIIEKLAAHDKRVRGIQFSRNFGQHYGITAGLDHCIGDWVVVMDYKIGQKKYHVCMPRHRKVMKSYWRGAASAKTPY
jgi:dolichol-phosphate mannosyltransferase